MPENNFEKRVQQKMEELRLPPSAEVWKEVEKRIRKEKKRRRFIIWFFLFGALLLGGAGWWAIDANKKQLSADNSVVQTTSDKKTDETTSSAEIETKNITTIEIKSDSNYVNQNQKNETQITNQPTVTKKETVANKKELLVKEIKSSKGKEEFINNSAPNAAENLSVKKEKPVLPIITKSDKPITIQEVGKPDSVNKFEKSVDASENKKIKDSIVTDKAIVTHNPTNITKPEVTVSTDSVEAKNTQSIAKENISKPGNNKWEFGIVGMAGSSKKSKPVSIFNNSSDALNAQPNSSSGSQAGNPVPRIRPAAPGSGFSWHIGAYAQRKLNTRTGLSMGLNFASYSTTQRTGAYVDSSGVFTGRLYSTSVQDFYRTGAASSHKNHYNYLQMPVSFHWQINRSVKLPVIFQNGFSIGFFAGSDALVYNATSNVFYKDNKSFNKLQFSYQSGLYTKLFAKTKNPFTAGILFDYQLSKLQKVNINGGNHLASFGVQLGWLLKK